MENNYTSNKFKQFSDFLRKIKIPPRVILLAIGFLSSLWFLIRVIPKPSRAGYPCMKVAAPFAASFITYLLGLGTFTFLMRKATERLKRSKYLVAFVFIILGFIAGTVTVVNNTSTLRAESFQGPQAANEPIGEAKGIFPGRVVWVFNPDATNEEYSNISPTYWYEEENTDQAEVTKMLSKGLQKMTGTTSDAAAWDAIFRYYNNNHGKGDVGYTVGEKIVFKINLNGMNNSNSSRNINTSPQICWALLNQLVNVAGVPQADIGFGDSNVEMNAVTYDYCHTDFPNVEYWGNGPGRTSIVRSASKVIMYSDGVNQQYLPQQYLDAEYMINVPVFKKHHRAGISLCAKNHFGSIAPFHGGAWDLHPSLPCPDATGEAVNGDYGSYRCFVDLMGHKELGGKTILYLIDGIWGSVNWGHPPAKFRMTPFNDDWPNSLFLSQDPVAIESVGFDFLYKEFDETHPTEGGIATTDKGPFPHFAGTDDYLQQAADPANWPMGINYDPENDGSVLGSLGTHEHWNNDIDKLYSRNLGTGDGIELVKVFPPASHLTPDNSGLLSDKVNAIFIDSFNIKWFATPLGISRYDDEDWDTINADNHLLNNNVKDMAYERTTYGHELWVATDGGLSVLMFNQVDGVTSATTYYTGDSESHIMSDTITAVGVDILHNRWIGTPAGLSVFHGSDWDSTKLYMDGDRNFQDLAGIDIVDIQSYPKDSMIYVNTHGGGTLRYTRNDVDGITAASSYEQVWGGMKTDTVNTVVIVDTIQWFGSNIGAFRHLGNLTKSFWTEYKTESGLISNNVTASEVDYEGNIWMGTDEGLSVLTPAGFYTYTTDDGLIDPMINDIKKDYEGNLYLATNGGVEVLTAIPGSFTMAVEPIQASDLVLEDIQTSSMTISWTSGEGTNRVVFVKEGNEGVVEPENNIIYTAYSTFPLGSAIGDWHCVYNGPGNTTTVTNLQPETEYRVMVCDYGDYKEYTTYSSISNYNNVATYTTLVEDINLLTDDQIFIYPTPFIDYMHITLSEVHEPSIARLFSMNGKLIRVVNLIQKENIINTSDIKSGVYIIVISNGDRSYSYKLVK